MKTNTRRVEIEGRVVDVPVELYSRAFAEAELRVQRRLVLLFAAEHPELGDELMRQWDEHEIGMRVRLRLPLRVSDDTPRQDS